MTILLTSLHFATVLLTVACTTTPLLAQQAAHQPTPARRTTIAAKPRATTAKTTMTAKPTTVGTSTTAQPSQPAATQASVSQPKTQPAVASTQPTPVRNVNSSSSVATPSTVKRSTASLSGSRNKYLNVGIGLAAYYGAGLPLDASFEVDER